MLIVKRTGLVPVRSRQGKVFGVSPKAAADGVRDRIYSLVPIPDGIETIEVAGPAPTAKVVDGPVEYDVPIPDDWQELHHLTRYKLARRLDPDLKAADGETKTQAADRVLAAEFESRKTPPSAG